MKLETFETFDDGIFGGEKEEIEDKIRTESKFKKSLRIFMIRNRIDIDPRSFAHITVLSEGRGGGR